MRQEGELQHLLDFLGVHAHTNWHTDGGSVVSERSDERLGGPENTTALPRRSLSLMVI